jgi:hypothetical protein
MGCCRIPAGYVLFVPVLFMWNVVLLLMHLLGGADCVVASSVFVIIIFMYIFEGPNTEFHQPLYIIRVSRYQWKALVKYCSKVCLHVHFHF